MEAGGTVGTHGTIFQLQDKPLVAESVFGDYRQQFAGSKTPIIIDNGSFRCRVGWGSENTPRLQYPPRVARAKQSAVQILSEFVGNNLKPVDFIRSVSAFEQDVVHNFDVMETLLDYGFYYLGIDSERIAHPLLMTEAVCNPGYTRRNMNELLFECYQVPSVCYGIDSMFSYYYNVNSDKQTTRNVENSLVISSGAAATHIIPYIGNKVQSAQIKRLSIGGYQTTDFMQKLLHVKYPGWKNMVPWDRAQEFKEDHAYLAVDYPEELAVYWDYPPSHNRIIQMPFAAPVAVEAPSAEVLEEKKNKRIEQGRKMSEKRKQQVAEKKEEQATLLRRIKSLQSENPAKFENMLKENEMTEKEFEKKFAALEPKVEAPEVVVHEYPLIGIPDSELTPEQRKEKKKQQFMKNSREGRERAKQKRDEMKAVEERLKSIEEEKRLQNPQQYIDDLKARKRDIMEKKQKRRKANSQTTTKRSTVGTHKRLRTIADNAFDDEEKVKKRKIKKKKESKNAKKKAKKSEVDSDDSFGENDEDWNIYLTLANEPDPESEEENAELARVQSLLDKYDVKAPSSRSAGLAADAEAAHQLYLNVERIRVPEIIFQPSIVGTDQMGLVEAIYHVLAQFPSPVQSLLTRNVFITGGNSRFPNFDERLRRDLTTIRPIGSVVNVFKASNGSLDAWRGGKLWSSSDKFAKTSITRAQYDEKGSDYFIEHQLSNTHLTP